MTGEIEFHKSQLRIRGPRLAADMKGVSHDVVGKSSHSFTVMRHDSSSKKLSLLSNQLWQGLPRA